MDGSRSHGVRGPRDPLEGNRRDAIGRIRASRDAAKVKVRRAVSRRTADPTERKRLFTALKADDWAADPYLSRMMRKHWRRGHSHVTDQIVIRADNVGRSPSPRAEMCGWPSPACCPALSDGDPLNTTVAPSGRCG